jgi:hypothetical protein
MLWQALSDLRASERPGEDSSKGDKPDDHGIVHLGFPPQTNWWGMKGGAIAKGRRRIGIVEPFNRAKLVSPWRCRDLAAGYFALAQKTDIPS